MNNQEAPHHAVLRGYLIEDNPTTIHVEDDQGSWIIKKSDIEKMEDWDGTDFDSKGKAVSVFIKDKAVLSEITPMTIDLKKKPITITDPRKTSSVEGNEILQKLGERYARYLGFKPSDFVAAVTVCCYQTGSFGLDCSGDDCG